MAEQWDPPPGESRGPGGPGLDRNALQATLADLVRAADGPAADTPEPAPAGDTARPVVPGAPVPTPTSGPPPLRGPVPRANDAPTQDPQVGPTAGGAVPRPALSGRPRLPFSPEPVPLGSAPVGTVRPGSGVAGGFSSSIAGAGNPALGSNPVIGGPGISAGSNTVSGGGVGGGLGGGLGGGTLGASSLGGRITPSDLGDNLARLTPTPTEQPTIPLRKRQPAGEGRAEPAAGGDAPAKAAQTPPQAARPAVAIEAWSPRYDDILPQRPNRSGRAFRRAR
jgi:hypothetical protein